MLPVSTGAGLHRLGLTRAQTSFGHGSGRRARRVVVHFEDWTVDGTPLRTVVGEDGPAQEMTPLSTEGFWPQVAADHLRQLLGEAPPSFPSRRVPLLVCPIDGDPGCAALSADLTIEEELVVWSDLGWQNDYEPFEPGHQLGVGDLRFSRSSYEELLRRTLTRFDRREL